MPVGLLIAAAVCAFGIAPPNRAHGGSAGNPMPRVADRFLRWGSMSILPPALALVAVLLVSCSNDGDTDDTTRRRVPASAGAAEAAGAPRYVVVGASDAVGYGAEDPDTDAWPEVLKRTVLPPAAELVNLGIPGATVAVALDRELPDALAEDADVVAVWLSVNDLLAQVPTATYEEQLGRLVRALRNGAGARVLVGNAPPLDRLPIYLACRTDPRCLGGSLPGPEVINGAVVAYNAAIDRVVAAEGAELVDLHAATLAARAAGTEASLVGADGFHPSTAGHRTVAAAFAAVLAHKL